MRKTHLDCATPEQRDYYERWRRDYENGNPPQLAADRVGYLWCYLRGRLADFLVSRDLDSFLEAVAQAERAYPALRDNRAATHEAFGELTGLTLIWRYDALLYLGEYDAVWRDWSDAPHHFGILPSHAWNIRSRCRTEQPLVGSNILVLVRNGSGLTKYGAAHKDELLAVATRRLAEYRERAGRDWLAGYFEWFNPDALTDDDFDLLRDLIGDDDEFARQRRTYDLMRQYSFHDEAYTVFYGTGLDVGIKGWSNVPNIVGCGAEAQMRNFLRGCEDDLRVSRGLPKIGEGWVTETDLFHKLRDAFPDEIVLHQSRPKWLGRQHLDIYFPAANIGVEYQGEQHQRPMEHLGGEERFQRQRELDDRKRTLCKANGCELIEVQPGTPFDEVRTRVEGLLAERHTNSFCNSQRFR